MEVVPAEFITEPAKAGDPVRIRCQLSVADEVNGNGRVYSMSVWSREIGKLQEKIKDNIRKLCERRSFKAIAKQLKSL